MPCVACVRVPQLGRHLSDVGDRACKTERRLQGHQDQSEKAYDDDTNGSDDPNNSPVVCHDRLYTPL